MSPQKQRGQESPPPAWDRHHGAAASHTTPCCPQMLPNAAPSTLGDLHAQPAHRPTTSACLSELHALLEPFPCSQYNSPQPNRKHRCLLPAIILHSRDGCCEHGVHSNSISQTRSLRHCTVPIHCHCHCNLTLKACQYPPGPVPHLSCGPAEGC